MSPRAGGRGREESEISAATATETPPLHSSAPIPLPFSTAAAVAEAKKDLEIAPATIPVVKLVVRVGRPRLPRRRFRKLLHHVLDRCTPPPEEAATGNAATTRSPRVTA